MSITILWMSITVLWLSISVLWLSIFRFVAVNLFCSCQILFCGCQFLLCGCQFLFCGCQSLFCSCKFLFCGCDHLHLGSPFFCGGQSLLCLIFCNRHSLAQLVFFSLPQAPNPFMPCNPLPFFLTQYQRERGSVVVTLGTGRRDDSIGSIVPGRGGEPSQSFGANAHSDPWRAEGQSEPTVGSAPGRFPLQCATT